MKIGILFLMLLLTAFVTSCEEETPKFTLIAVASPLEGGKVSYNPKLDSYDQGQLVTIIHEANAGWVFKEWSGDESGDIKPLTVQLNSNKTIFGIFVKLFALDYRIVGKGEIVEKIVENPSGREFPEGSRVEITPVPEEGWLFESWSMELDGGIKVTNESPKWVNVNMDKTIEVRFVPKPQGDPRFYLAENGITCKCENVIAGSKGLINGVEYEAVNNEFLKIRLDEKANMTKVCTSLVTDMSGLFTGSNFNQPIGNWDTSNVTDMSYLFMSSNFNQPIGSWDVSNVTDMTGMFSIDWFGGYYDAEFNQPIDQWDVSNVTDMYAMFYGSKFNQPIGSWDVSNVTNMNEMFNGSKFNQPIGSWDVSNVTNMGYMFAGLGEESPVLFNQPIRGWDVSKVTNMNGMFQNNFYFNQDLSNWCVSKVPSFPQNFYTTGTWLLPKPNWGTCPD